MRDDNGRGLFIFVFLVLPAIYIVWVLMPLLLFYVLPFAVISLLFGWLWGRLSKGDYRVLLVLLSVSHLLLVFTVGFPKPVLLAPKGQVYLQSVFLYHLFQAVDS